MSAEKDRLKPSKRQVGKRRDAAEEVCWSLLLMMGLGGLELPQEWRDFLAGPVQVWADLATATGVMSDA